MSCIWRDDKDKDLSNDDIAQKSLGRKAFCHFHQSKGTTTMYIQCSHHKSNGIPDEILYVKLYVLGTQVSDLSYINHK